RVPIIFINKYFTQFLPGKPEGYATTTKSLPWKLFSEPKISRRPMFARTNLLEVWQEAVEADRQIAIPGDYRTQQENYRFFQARIKDFVSKNTKPAKVTV
ncbi:MAG: hypothetical protein ACKO90_01285, partial [Microcystis panniformis]